MTLDLISIKNKLNLMADYLTEIELLSQFSVDEICRDVFKYRASERLQELIIQASLDINRHLLKELYRSIPKTNADVFIESSRVDILPEALANRLVEASKFRNLLVHQYEKIVPSIVVQNIELILEDYRIYIDSLSNYLTLLEENDEQDS